MIYENSRDTPATVTVALSGGGVAGLGHVPVLAALDELHIKPVAIAGSSMGAVVAALYGAGMSALEIEAHVLSIVNSPLAYTRKYISGGWQGLLTGDIKPEVVIDTIVPPLLPESLQDMLIPITVVATDFHRREQVLFRHENTRLALAASIAIPGVFNPLEWDGRVLVDGGVTNNLPVDVLPPSDITLAVDVASEPLAEDNDVPGAIEAVTSSVRIMLRTMTEAKVKLRENVILVQPESRKLSPLDLTKIDDAIEMSRPQTEQVKQQLLSLGLNF